MTRGFDSVVEHRIDMALAGRPRWWSVTLDAERLEVVRVDFTQRDPTLLLFVVLAPGVMKWPALVGAYFNGGEQGLDYLTNKMGARIFPIGCDMGRALELRLVGLA